MKKLSVIIPAYNEENMIGKTCSVISALLEREKIDYEIIFVNDGSTDMTWLEILQVCEQNGRVKGLCFARNFGKEPAMFAGLEKASGDCAVIIDCDLQHPPEKIVEMYRLWEDGYQIVEGVKKSRGKESAFYRFCAKTFYKIISKVTGTDMTNSSDFKLIDRKVIDALKMMPERNVFFRAMSSWVGFKKTTVYFDVQPRTAGKSRFTKLSLIRYALSNISSFSAAPMQLVTILGIIFLFIALVLGVQSLVYKIIGKALEGFTTVIIIELLVGAIVMTSLGIVGYYISRMYEELKGRPRYILSNEVNLSKDEEKKNDD